MNKELKSPNTKAERKTAYQLSASLIQQDWHKIIAAIALCSSPRLLSALILGTDSPELWLLFLTRILELSCLYYLAHPILQSFRSQRNDANSLMSLIILGIFYWLIVRSPLIVATSISTPEVAATSALLLIVPAVAFGLIYFFYFFPICAGVKDLKLALNEARWITKQDPYAPFRALLAPLAVYFLVNNLAAIGSPDSREYYMLLFDCVSSEIPFFLLIYTSLGQCLSIIKGKKWHDYNFNPYREARFETISISAPQQLTRILSPKTTILILLTAFLLGYANLIRTFDLPPSPQITIDQVTVEQNLISLELNLDDFEFRFRGFQPRGFKLAGPKGTSIHSLPPTIEFKLNQNYTTATLKLEFETEMKQAEILLLQDLSLWYLNTKLEKIEFKNSMTH